MGRPEPLACSVARQPRETNLKSFTGALLLERDLHPYFPKCRLGLDKTDIRPERLVECRSPRFLVNPGIWVRPDNVYDVWTRSGTISKRLLARV
jgi:hypothetical protein